MTKMKKVKKEEETFGKRPMQKNKKRGKVSGVSAKNKKKTIKEISVTKELSPVKDGDKGERRKVSEGIPDADHAPNNISVGDPKSETKKSIQSENTRQKYMDFTENTVFVGNLPVSYDKKKLIKYFSRFGKVISARIRCVPVANINMRKKVAAIKKEFNPLRNSLVGYVKFKLEDSVKAALEANGTILDGHHLRIDSAKSSDNRDVNKAIFVGGLPFDIEDDELWEFFENCGKINSVRIIRDSHTSMGKGIGYVNFNSTTSVELALQMDGQELKKRTINVKRCIDNKKKNKMKSFGKNKTKEVVTELLSKKNQTKTKIEKNKLKSVKNSSTPDFLGSKAGLKKKKKKKPSKDVLHKRKIVKILGKNEA